jgi:alpha-glucosidase
MLRNRAYELRLPADWPPESVSVNGAAIRRAGPTGKGGWSYEGNTLTTMIPVPSSSVESRVTIEVRRAQGSTARRAELDGFAGAMNRLRGAYEAMHETHPVSYSPDPLVDAMQSGDRLGYQPEKAVQELAHFREALPEAQAALDTVAKDFAQRLNNMARDMSLTNRASEVDAQKQRRTDALARAQKLTAEAADQAGKEPAKVTPALAGK